MFRIIITAILIFISVSVNADDLNLVPDYSEAFDKTSVYIASINSPIVLYFINIFKDSLWGLVYLVLGILFSRGLLSKLNFMSIKSNSLYGLAMNVLACLSCPLQSYLIVYSAAYGFYISMSMLVLILPSFFEASTIDKSKLMSDAEAKAKYANVLYLQKSATYNLNKFQFIRENTFKYQKDGFTNCLMQNYDLDVGRNKGIVTDENARNLNNCASVNLGIKGVGLGSITYDSTLSASFNNSMIAKNLEIADMVQDLVRTVCAYNYSNRDETDIFMNCSEMEKGKVLLSGSKNYVVPMQQSNKTKAQVQADIERLVNSMTAITLSEVERTIDEEVKKIDSEIKNVKLNPFTLILITLKASNLKSDIEAKVNAIIYSNNIEVKYENIQKNSAEKIRYSAEKYLTDKTIDNYSIKLQLDKIINDIANTKGYAQNTIDKTVNSFTGNIFMKNGFSNAECRTDHEECNIPSFNVLSNIVQFSMTNMRTSFSYYMGYSAAYEIVNNLKFDNVKQQLVSKGIAARFKNAATLYKWQFFISVYGTIAVMMGCILPYIGYFLMFIKLILNHAITVPLKTLVDTVKKPIEDDSFSMKWATIIPVALIAPTLFLFSLIILLFLISIGAVVISFSIHIVAATIFPISQSAIGVFELIAHLMYYISMTFLVIKNRKIVEQLFVFALINAILNKTEKMSNEFADDTENALNKIFNKAK